MMHARGLSRIALPMLEQLHVMFESGRLDCPFSEGDLVEAGFRGHARDVLETLGDADKLGVLVALRVAIAERIHRPPPRLDLVWTGPETKASISRSTSLVVERLFESAHRSVIVCGYTFDTPDILRPLHRAMVERAVSVMVFVDIPGTAKTAAGAGAFAAATIDKFFRTVWTFGAPKPDVYYDPRTATPGPPWASLHAKCIVVDDARTLVTSANFTDRGQSRNIEAGVVIEDEVFSEELSAQWRQLVSEGLVNRYVG